MRIKLALRNVRRTAASFSIYLVTLSLSVGLFYGFLSLASVHYQETLPIALHLDVLQRVMKMAVPLVGLLLIFLMKDVNDYLFRRKQQEFAVETVIGMERRTVAGLFFLETVILGLPAIGIGIGLGVIFSQFIQVAVVRTFDLPYTLHLLPFPDTVLWTVTFFCALLVMLGAKNGWAVQRLGVKQMLENSQRGDELQPAVRQLGSWVAVYGALSLAVGVAALVLLPKAVGTTAALGLLLALVVAALIFVVAAVWFFRCKKVVASSQLVVFLMSALAEGGLLALGIPIFEAMVRQGMAPQAYVILPPMVAVLFLVFALVVFFCAFNGFMLRLLRPDSARYYRHLFLLGQLRSRMNTGAKRMGLLTCVLTVALVLFAFLPILALRIQAYQAALSVYDVQIGTMLRAEKDLQPQKPLDEAFITEQLAQAGYPAQKTASGALYFMQPSDVAQSRTEGPFLAVTCSSYNALRQLSNLAPVQLAPDSFGIAWSSEVQASTIAEFAQQTVRAGTKTLAKAPAADFQDGLGIVLFTSQTSAVYVIPDEAAQGLQMATCFFAADTAQALPYDVCTSLEAAVTEHEQRLAHIPEGSLFVRLQTLQVAEGQTNMLLMALLGAYMALILLLSSLTLLSVQQLTDAFEQKQRFAVLRRLGVAKPTCRRWMWQQLVFCFGLPAVVAMLVAFGVLVGLIAWLYEDMVAYLSLATMGAIGGVVWLVFLMIFLCYFLVTSRLFQKLVAL